MKTLVASLLPVLTFLLTPLSTAFAAHVFTGIDLRSGKDTSILREDTDKKATVLIFMSSKCPCSMSHADEVARLAKDYPEFRFIGVNANSDEAMDDARKYFEKQDFNFPVLKDDKGILADEFKALKTPHAFVINAEGKRLFQGGVSNSATFARADRKYLREALEDIKTGHEVRTPLARALGCAIAR